MKGQSREGQIKVFEEIFHTYYERLARYAFTLTNSETKANDIVQSVFVKVWDKRDMLVVSDNFESYLYRATYNLSLNEIRNTKIKSQYIDHITRNSPGTDNTHNEIMEHELAEQIDKIMNGLPGQCKAIFQKSRLEGKKYKEIAEEMNLSVKTVETQIGRALARFRKELKDYLIILIFMIMIFTGI